MLIAHPRGHYHFLRGIEPYSCGVVADPGYEIVHFTLAEPLPWRDGFVRVDACLSARGLERTALCAVELRAPAPFTMRGFIDFNRDYCERLQEWDLYVDGLNPVARTHVAPFHRPPPAPQLHAFSLVVPSEQRARRTFVVAGAGELVDGILEEERIIRPGDTSPAALREKAAYVVQVMAERLRGLHCGWEQVDVIDIYTIYPLQEILRQLVLPAAGAAARHGVRWHYARPPVVDIDFEMDLRGVAASLLV